MKDYFGYNGKVCVVTGASSGMGKAAAEMLVDLGAKVYALDYNACPVEGIEKFVQVNLGNKDSIDGCFNELPEKSTVSSASPAFPESRPTSIQLSQST